MHHRQFVTARAWPACERNCQLHSLSFAPPTETLTACFIRRKEFKGALKRKYLLLGILQFLCGNQRRNSKHLYSSFKGLEMNASL